MGTVLAMSSEALYDQDSLASTFRKSSESIKKFIDTSLLWLDLLFAAQPEWVDYLLITCGTLCAVAAGVPFPLMGVLFGQIVDNFNSATCAAEGELSNDPFQYEHAINDKVIKTAYIGAIALVLIYGHLTCWNIISQRLAHRMRTTYVSALLRQPPSYFDAHVSSGQVSNRLNGDITAIQAGTSEKVGNIITTISFFVTVFIIAFSKQPRLAGILISMVPAFLLSGAFVGRRMRKYVSQQAADVKLASSVASEALSHIEVVQAFGAAPRLEAKFTEHITAACKHGITKSAIAAIQTGLLYFIAYSGNALAFWQGSFLIVDSFKSSGNGTTVGEIYAIVYLLVDACVMLGSIAPSLPFLSAATAAYKELKKDITASSAIDGTSEKGEILTPSKAKTLRFQDVAFEYNSRPGQLVLSNLNIEFAAGKHTAIVGLSGSGKSTVASLIVRLYDPTRGKVQLDGHDLRDLNVRSLRSFIGFVQQEPTLFDRSIFENIALGLCNSPRPEFKRLMPFLQESHLARIAAKGKDALSFAKTLGPEFSKIAELVQRAADVADALTFIEQLNEGFGTPASICGSRLSGGQRQRIALARALIREPEILVLDEATSALDSASERKIQAAVERVAAGGNTVISIAHRLSTIRNADHILVMKAGQVVQQGTYSGLMSDSDGEFAHMVRLQDMGKSDATDCASLTDDSTGLSPAKDESPVDEKSLMQESDRRGTHEKMNTTSGENEIPRTSEIEDSDSVTRFSSVIKGLAWLLRPQLALLALAISSAIIVGCTFSGAGIIFGFTVGRLNPCQNTVEGILEGGRFFAGMYFLLASVEFIANFLMWWTFGVIAEKLLYNLRALSFGSLLEQSVNWYTDNGRTPTSLLSIITRDSTAVSNFGGSTFGTVFAICVNVVVAIIVSFIFAWKIAIVCLVTLPILLGTGFMQLRMLARYEERHQNAFTTATSLATEAIQSIKTVAVLSLEREYMESFKSLLESPRRQVVRASATTNVWLAISYTTGIFVNALAYWWGSQLIMKGQYSQKDFLVVLVAMLISAQLWSGMFALAPEFSRARLALTRVMDTINIGSKSQIEKKPPGALNFFDDDEAMKGDLRTASFQTHPRGGSKVAFVDVSFAYPNSPHTTVLDKVSFTIAPNQFFGLVGPSGSGKSTILKLVQRLYRPTHGAIYIDDRDISTLSPSFRDTIAIVPQEPSLFDGSIRFNVGLGAPPYRQATDAEIEEACHLANIHEVIKNLPDGYETQCGPSASRLSGGQKQRIAIARALIRRPCLLLLDESTSALDAESEAEFHQALKKVARCTTIIAIAHRLRTVQEADSILLVEGGRIVDSGRHSELMERRESYRLNVMQQMLH
ncbi:uncharacterized protein PV09_07489 [Verruconis gallopava]|uniref:Leptomycin B resistance protein pmd1 n=1 Tax=Verruconis gallopava TaxID=253628 RepID=A0A0D1YJB5_9PEZI|nr:uncharacterized protein PV09_07489 [Verruconis gallopava]KIW00967.1 hypothetical protein PV09_07489 [Verruconis gallopava]